MALGLVALVMGARTSEAQDVGALARLVLEQRQQLDAQGPLIDDPVVECDASETFSLLAEWNARHAFDRFLESGELVILQGMRLLLRDDPHAVIDEIVTRARLPFVQARRDI